MLKRGVLGLISLAVISVCLYHLVPNFESTSLSSDESLATIAQDSVEVIKPPEPKKLYGVVVDSMVVIEDKIKRNQNISEILSNYNIPSESIYKLAKASKEVFDVRKLAANKKYTLICTPDSLKTARAMIYEHNPVEYVVFNLLDSITVEKGLKEVEVVEKSISGTIEASLSLTMDQLGLSYLTNDFADIFAWQIDFFRLQRGDRFKLVYEDELIDGHPIRSGKIKAIYFEHFGNGYYAYHFDQGSDIDYFDEKGNSLRKALLKYPLEFTRISSRYSGRRYHPVQKRYKAHRGTDFAAPRGTPIRSVGDGIVLEARYSKYNGNYVKIRHNATYTTQYLHMSKIASGLKPGQRVKQEQTIGYVGSTGLATGNHLCYRFWKNGVQIDALKVDLPPSEPVAEENKEAFANEILLWNERLDQISFPVESAPILARSN
ncbi:peptidase M23 [Fulvivirga sp. RKSG066]|uniref:peptidoglycan DD-metalloendopeptidase family protein n=1 Tax=Fulvivirga aurantia TaxID=2529383 RepID=UPI0012BD1D4C|nr:peptidoglycan DD-metalloendopeptidase family protein [Fulvivirga aurantia]MTI22707.1 peptidase M23 [Fulvivirga aurantia]